VLLRLLQARRRLTVARPFPPRRYVQAVDAAIALSLAPHPDDELIGAPATLLALRDFGFDVVSVPLGFGKAEDSERRGREAREAARRAGLRFEPPHCPIDLTTTAASNGYAGLDDSVADVLERFPAALVVSPSPHDRHPGHEATARSLIAAVERRGSGRLWMWSLWGSLPLPTLGVRYDRSRLEEVLSALEAYTGEIFRNDYRRLVEGRGDAAAVLAPEVLFGFGSPGIDGYVELLTEVVYGHGEWLLGTARWFSSDSVFAPPSGISVSDWLNERSVTDRYGVPGAAADG
jgi:LmbE family N-acetylglucosaminyl deacetylase